MPKTTFENVVFTIIMATIMVYGMIVYNVALNTGGVTNATFVKALHELPIMMPIAFVLEFFVVEKLATRLAFSFMRPTDPPYFPAAVPPEGGGAGRLTREIQKKAPRPNGTRRFCIQAEERWITPCSWPAR